MNRLTSLTVPLIFFLLLSPSEAVPKSSHSECDIHTSIINCYGRSINKGSLDQLKDQLSTHYRGMYFSELMLSATEVTKIGAGLFADVEFENVIISDNQLLEEVNEAAFGTSNISSTPTVRSLTVIGNPLLKGTALYQIAQRLAVKEQVDFDSNSLEVRGTDTGTAKTVHTCTGNFNLANSIFDSFLHRKYLHSPSFPTRLKFTRNQ